MKSILFVAAALMIGASVYGFVNYSKTSRQKEFKNMYEEPVVKSPSVAEEQKQAGIVQPVTDLKKSEETVKAEQPVKTTVKKMGKKKKRTFNYKSFGRAALKEFVPPVTEEEKAKEQ